MKVVFLHGLGQTARDWQAVIDLTLLPDVDCPELFSLTKGDITYPDILAGFEKNYEDTTEPFLTLFTIFSKIISTHLLLALIGLYLILSNAAEPDFRDFCGIVVFDWLCLGASIGAELV